MATQLQGANTKQAASATRKRIIYQSEALFAGSSTAPVNIQRVQSANYAFTVPRVDVNQYGQLGQIERLIVEVPTVSLDFSYSLDNIFKKTDFCITRAGASTLAELVYFEIPFLTIPFPYSKDNHQLLNAQFYKDHNCCWMIEQKNVSKKTFFETISNIITDKIEIDIKKKAMNELSKKNTWENNNKLIIKTINEN